MANNAAPAVGCWLPVKTERHSLKSPSILAALQALTIAGPAVPFVGVPVLGFLYGDLRSLPVALCSIIMNLVQVPVTLFILARGNEEAGAPPASIVSHIRDTLAEPVVWAPILAFLMLLDLYVPKEIRSSMQLLGGGSFLMSSQEIETAVREQIPLKVLVSVDDSYGLIKWKMDMEEGAHDSVDFGNPDFVRYAESFGANGHQVTSAEQWLPTLRQALDEPGVSIVGGLIETVPRLRVRLRGPVLGLTYRFWRSTVRYEPS